MRAVIYLGRGRRFRSALRPLTSLSKETSSKLFGELVPRLCRTQDGEVVLEPEKEGPGYWVGAPSIFYDRAESCWWLTYRRRRPRGTDPDGLGDRGYLACVARSADGLHFEDVWVVTRGAWRTPSMERFSLVHDANVYRLYVSYADSGDNRWRIDLLEASHPSRFDPAALQHVLTVDDVQGTAGEKVEGVKDPWVFRFRGIWHMLVSCAVSRHTNLEVRDAMHETADVYNTGLITAPTALATSTDGRRWQWQQIVLGTGPSGSWDGYQARLNSVIPGPGFWLGFYDGAETADQNYEERCGLAASFDLRQWTKLTPQKPAFGSESGTGSVRYVEAVLQRDSLHCYYE